MDNHFEKTVCAATQTKETTIAVLSFLEYVNFQPFLKLLFLYQALQFIQVCGAS